MKNLLYILAGLSLACGATSCKPTLDAPEPNTADLNFSRYVAVGDYATAGFMNGGVSRESQQTAYPAILAQQFAASGNAVPFEQPYFTGSGTQMVDLNLNAAGIPVLSNTQELATFLLAGCNTTQTIYSDQYSNSVEQTAALQNLGVPGLKITQISLVGLGNDVNATKPNSPNAPAAYNPYFDRMLPAGENRTYLDVVRNSKPTFFTVWIGMTDVINYAMSGASCGRLPTATQFQNELFNVVDTLSGGGKRNGVICNIPSVQYLGFPKSLSIQSKFRQQRNDPNLKIWIKALKIPNTTNYEIIEISDDHYITPAGLKMLGVDEQVTINSVQQTIPHGLSELNPLTESEVLDKIEAGLLESSISIGSGLSNPSYNGIINNMVSGTTSKFRNKVVLANMQQLYGSITNGVNFNGVTYNLDPVAGGFYSFDFFSPSQRGQAIIANHIIKAINENFKSNIFEVNVNNFPAQKRP